VPFLLRVSNWLIPALAETGGKVVDLTRGERLQIMLTKSEVEALDSWRFSRHMPSRAAAVRELLKRGLVADGFDLAEPGRKSADYGVTGAPAGDRDASSRGGT